MKLALYWLVLMFFVHPAMTAPAPRIPASAGTNALVQAFDEGCLPRKLDYEHSNKRARNLGWRETPHDSHPQLKQVMDQAALMREHPSRAGWKYEHSIYQKKIAGRQIYLVKKRIFIPSVGNPLNCSVYDFAATSHIDPGPLNRLLGRKFSNSSLDKASKDHVSPRLIISFEWLQQDLKIYTQLMFIPQTSPLVIKTGFTGLTIRTTTPGTVTNQSK